MKNLFVTLFVVICVACGGRQKMETASPKLTGELIKAIQNCIPDDSEPDKEKAFAKCDAKEVARLLESGADPNANAYNDAPLLFLTVIPPEVYTLLLEAGANPNVRFVYISDLKTGDLTGTPLIATMGTPGRDSAEYDHERDNILKNVNLLTQKVGNINEVDSDGFTAISRCVESMLKNKPEEAACTIDFVRLLVQNNADPTIKNKNGESALSLLCHAGTYDGKSYSLAAKKAITETLGLSLKACN